MKEFAPEATQGLLALAIYKQLLDEVEDRSVDLEHAED